MEPANGNATPESDDWTSSTTVSSSQLQESSSGRASVHRLLDTAHSLLRALRFFATFSNDPKDNLDIATLSRVRARIEGIARLLSQATKDLRVLGVDKKSTVVIDTHGNRLSLQDLSRAIRAIQIDLRKINAGDPFSSIANILGTFSSIAATVSAWDVRPLNTPPGNNQPTPPVIDLTKDNSGMWEALGNFFTFNGTEDDNARKLVAEKSCDGLQELGEENLTKLINAMLDGPTGDDDERGILKILDCLDCKRVKDLVGRVGLKNLLSDIDGEEWDRLVIRLLKCGIISFDKFDDDASRKFVNNHDCSQLGVLNMDSVRQLILNMFAGSCGDDDEDAILKLLRCQSTARLNQLVGMAGTDVGAFDYNFDGSQWDDLEKLFAANGIVLDP